MHLKVCLLLIQSPKLTPFEKTGVSVALLVWLVTAVDSSTFQDAQKSQWHSIQSVLAVGLLNDQPLVHEAVVAFLESEKSFIRSLASVYKNVVLKVSSNVA